MGLAGRALHIYAYALLRRKAEVVAKALYRRNVNGIVRHRMQLFGRSAQCYSSSI